MRWKDAVAKALQADWFSTDISEPIKKRYPGGHWVHNAQEMAQAEKQGLAARAILRNPFKFETPTPMVFMAPQSAQERKDQAQNAIWFDLMKDW
jgi:hypothetical protein